MKNIAIQLRLSPLPTMIKVALATGYTTTLTYAFSTMAHCCISIVVTISATGTT